MSQEQEIETRKLEVDLKIAKARLFDIVEADVPASEDVYTLQMMAENALQDLGEELGEE